MMGTDDQESKDGVSIHSSVWSRDVEERMQGFYQTLSENDHAMRRSRHGNRVVAAYPTLPKCWDVRRAPSNGARPVN